MFNEVVARRVQQCLWGLSCVLAIAAAVPVAVANLLAVAALPSALHGARSGCEHAGDTTRPRRLLAWIDHHPALVPGTASVRGWFEAAAGCPADAIKWLTRARTNAADDLMLTLRLGEALSATGEAGAALRVWQSAPAIAQRHRRAAEERVRAGAWPAALTEATLAVSIDPRDPSAYRWRGLALGFGHGCWPEAIEELRRARSLGERDPYVTVEIAHALQIAGRSREAFDELQGYEAPSGLADSIRGSYHLGAGEIGQAIRFFQRSARLEPGDPWVRHALATAYARQGLRDEAIAELDKALVLAPFFAPAVPLRQCLVAQKLPSACLGR